VFEAAGEASESFFGLMLVSCHSLDTVILMTRTTLALRTGQLVDIGTLAKPIFVKVQHRSDLDLQCVDTELTDAGWRLAEFDGGFSSVLVRLTDKHSFLRGWGSTVAEVEIMGIFTGTRFWVDSDGEDKFAIVTEQGEVRKSGRTRVDLLTLERDLSAA